MKVYCSKAGTAERMLPIPRNVADVKKPFREMDFSITLPLFTNYG